MATETVTLKHRWRRWRGTGGDVLRLARLFQSIGVAGGEDDLPILITVARDDGETRYNSVEEAADGGLADADLSQTKQVHVLLGHSLTDLRAIATFSRSGVSLEVSGTGDSHLMVPGALRDMKQELDRGNRELPYERPIVLALFAIYLPIVAAGLVLRYGLGKNTLGTILIWSAMPFIAGVWAITLIRPYFVPSLEFVSPHRPPKAERLGRPLLKLLGWLATLLAGAVLGALVQNWLD